MTAPKGIPERQHLLGREAALKRLKAFSKATIDQLSENLGDTVVRETDRGTVILLSTAVEDMLDKRIRAAMVPLNSDETARIFGADAVLGTFSAKIKIAHAMGYIDRETARMCDLVREMRNACAHSRRDISFANNELSDVMAVAYGYLSDEQALTSNYKDMDFLGKLHFIWLISYLMHVIRTGSKDSGIEIVNDLIADANSAAQVALKRQRSAEKRKAASNSLRTP